MTTKTEVPAEAKRAILNAIQRVRDYVIDDLLPLPGEWGTLDMLGEVYYHLEFEMTPKPSREQFEVWFLQCLDADDA